MMCQKCRHISDFQAHIFEGPTPPLCPQCVAADTLRTAHAGKRSHGVGRLRPRIVLYNEHNPDDEAIGAVTTADFRTRPDAVVVVGTSMKIPAVRRIVHEMCQIVRDRREGTTIWINRDPVPPGKDLENLWDLVVKADSDEVARLAGLREWDDERPDVKEHYTEADLEKVKSSQGDIEVVIPPSPTKIEKPIQRLLPSPVLHTMTPPRSQNGDAPRTPSKTPRTPNGSPLRIKLNVTSRSENLDRARARQKNAASNGKKIVDVLGKENQTKSSLKSKTSLNRQPKVTKIRASNKSRTQTRITTTHRVTKSVVTSVIVPKKQPPEPLSPRRHSNETVYPAEKSEYSSVEVSPAPETPPSMSCSEWRSANTISPSGRVPNDMIKLLN